MARASQACLRALISSDTEDQDSDDSDATPKLTDDEAICQSMEQLFRVGVPQPRFKVLPFLLLVPFSDCHLGYGFVVVKA